MVPVLAGTDPLRGVHAQLLAIDLLGRPNSDSEPIPRTDLLSLTKLAAEGTPSEQMTVLGWHLDTHRLLISLPPDKYDRYKKSVTSLVTNGSRHAVSKQTLESTVGQLEHVATIVPCARHFLSRLRRAAARPTQYRPTRLTTEELADLSLWLLFLKTASAGIDINVVVPDYQQEYTSPMPPPLTALGDSMP